MALGPMLIFDKSTLQSLSPDESVWLENFFLTNITPLFYIETLADLEKEARSGRTPEQIVGGIARKAPDMSSYPNVHHTTLLAGELQGFGTVDMRYGRPIIGGGRAVSLGNETGMLFQQDPETEAFQRWQRGDFLELERQAARKWRQALSNINHEENYQIFKSLYLGQQKPKSFEEVKALVDNAVNNLTNEDAFGFALDVVGVPQHSKVKVLERYRNAGSPSMRQFAPYFAYIFSVELFFYLGMAADLISRERPSNKVDLAYLYYLPFCMVFTSNDKLHERMVPLFLRENQDFVKGSELKDDLRKLNTYYEGFSDEAKLQGVMRFAPYPPTEGSYLISQLWDKHLPIWRKHAAERTGEPWKEDMKTASELIEKIRQFKEEAKPIDPATPVNSDHAQHVGFERKASLYKGSWRRFPPEVEEAHKRKE